MKCKVSIIVPVYNVYEYLEKCLISLVNQTLKDIEIIIVNDGSTDDSQLIIDEYKNKYPNLIKSYIKENGGLSSARNYGIIKSSGEFIGFVDSDDYVKIDMYEKMYNMALKNDSDVVICDTIITDGNKEFVLKSNLNYSNDIVKNYIITYPMACTRLIRKELFKENFIFTLNTLYEDLCLMPTIALITNKISFINEPLYYYYKRKDSIMNNNKFKKKHLDIFTVLDSVYNKFKEYNLDTKYNEELEYLYITHLLRSATFRFISYENYELCDKINEVIDNKFKNWNQNKYYKKSSLKLRIMCSLARKKNYKIIRIILKMNGGN